MNLKIKFQPKQGLYNYLIENSPKSWLGYGGSRGGAKSGGLRRVMVKRRLDHPGTNGLIMRRVWDDVLKNHVNMMWVEFPELFPFYKSGEKAIYLPNGSKIFFDGAENKGDVERKAYGPEYMDFFLDQAEQFTEEEIVQLKTVVRWPGMDEHACKFGLFFNPGGESSAYLQRIFYTYKYQQRENPKDYGFVQAYGWDNVEWCRSALVADGLTEEDFYSWPNDKRFNYYISRSQYGMEQNALPAHKRAGQLMGDFQKFAGQYFSNFDPATHVWDLDEIDFKPWWPRWISIDWGFSHHTSVHWHCQAGNVDESGKSKSLVITYREFTTSGMSERALAEEIVARNDGDRIGNVFGGHDLWVIGSNNRSKEAAMSAVFRAHGLPTMKRAVIDRVDGWQHMYMVLDEGEWIITSNCEAAVNAIPVAIFNTKRPGKEEDVLKTNTLADDVLDELRYGLYSMYAAKDAPAEIKMQQAASAISDRTNRNILMMRMSADIDRKKRNLGAINSRSAARSNRYANTGRGRRIA